MAEKNPAPASFSVAKTEDEWKAELAPEEYAVIRGKVGTREGRGQRVATLSVVGWQTIPEHMCSLHELSVEQRSGERDTHGSTLYRPPASTAAVASRAERIHTQITAQG